MWSNQLFVIISYQAQAPNNIKTPPLLLNTKSQPDVKTGGKRLMHHFLYCEVQKLNIQHDFFFPFQGS